MAFTRCPAKPKFYKLKADLCCDSKILSENGPDLYVYLVRNETGTPRNDQDLINLGKLRSTTGSFNMDIPAGVDLSGVQSATIWCQAFRVNFGFARFQTP